MPKVDFYSNKKASIDQSLRTVCRLAEKALHAGHIIYIKCKSQSESEKLDTLLWTFRDRSFVPHGILGADGVNCPITIGWDRYSEDADMLINLSNEIPKEFDRYHRIAEIIENEENSIRAGRERYRFYRDQGLDPNHHEI